MVSLFTFFYYSLTCFPSYNRIKKLCTGETSDEDIPIDRSGATGTVINNHLYMFGGYSEEGNLNSLHRLNLHNLKWRHLQPTGNAPLPCDKVVCWQFEEKLYLFAGYGRGPDPAQWRGNLGYQFILDASSHWVSLNSVHCASLMFHQLQHYLRGWNNQFVCYDPVSNSWQWPKCSGLAPVARAAHAAAKIGKDVYIFGGRNGRMRMNDMYVLDMSTFVWKQIMANDEDHPVKGRSWHSLTPLSDHNLLLYGGFSMDSKPLNDCWLFNTHDYTWQQVALPFDKPRLWHSACLSSFGEGRFSLSSNFCIDSLLQSLFSVLICGGAIANIVVNMCRQHSNVNYFQNTPIGSL